MELSSSPIEIKSSPPIEIKSSPPIEIRLSLPPEEQDVSPRLSARDQTTFGADPDVMEVDDNKSPKTSPTTPTRVVWDMPLIMDLCKSYLLRTCGRYRSGIRVELAMCYLSHLYHIYLFAPEANPKAPKSCPSLSSSASSQVRTYTGMNLFVFRRPGWLNLSGDTTHDRRSHYQYRSNIRPRFSCRHHPGRHPHKVHPGSTPPMGGVRHHLGYAVMDGDGLGHVSNRHCRYFGVRDTWQVGSAPRHRICEYYIGLYLTGPHPLLLSIPISPSLGKASLQIRPLTSS